MSDAAASSVVSVTHHEHGRSHPKRGKCKSSFTKKKRLQRRPGQSLAEWVTVFEKVVLDMKGQDLQVDLVNIC